MRLMMAMGAPAKGGGWWSCGGGVPSPSGRPEGEGESPLQSDWVHAEEGAHRRDVEGLALRQAAQLVLLHARAAGEAAAVRAALGGVWRASSLVECLNSVARMQQARHRRMTPGLLDLKRLYWNLRRFRTGPRRGKTPYELLGLDLAGLPWWELLRLSPEQLRQRLSAPRNAA